MITTIRVSRWLLLLGTAAAIIYADDSYQSYIEALAYPARLMVRPDASTVVAGGTISFFCRADGNPLPNILWKVNNLSPADSRYITKSTSTGLSTLRIEPVTLADNNTVISCSADNGVANPVVTDAVLTVVNKDQSAKGFPYIDQHPTLKSVEAGRTAHVSCRVHGEPRPKVLWLRDMVPIDIRAEGRYSVSTMGNPGALMIQQAREEDQGRYECVARNAHGVVHSKAAHLYVKVRRVPPYFSMNPNRTYSVGMGGEVNLTCVAVGYPMPRVFWKKSGDVVLDDPASAPIGKNVLTLSNVEQSENFTCVAVSKLGNIEHTTTVEVKALPSPPRHLKISRVTPHSVTLTWERPRTEEPIRKYLVKYRLKIIPPPPPTSPLYAETSVFKERSVDESESSYTVEGLHPFQLYEFIMHTVCDVGSGTPSNPLEAQTEETAPSTPPIKAQARSLSRDSILVKWAPSEKPNGLITAYKIYYTTQEPSTPLPLWKTHETKADELMATLYNLEVEKKYHVHVQAKNSKGNSPLSILVTVSTIYGLPAQPPLVEAKALDARRIQLSWERPIHSTPVTGYVIIHNDTDGSRELTLTSPHEKHLITGLQANSHYSFRVAAISSRGQGELTEPIVVQTLQSVLTGPPTITQLYALTSKSIKVIWSPPAKSLTNGAITEYVVKYRPVDDLKERRKEISDEESEEELPEINWQHVTVPGVLNTTNLTELEPFTVYEVAVAASTELGPGPDSVVIREKTKEDEVGEKVVEVPSAPRNFEVILTGPNTVKLKWDSPANNHGGLMGYYFYVSKLHNGVPVDDHVKKAKILNDRFATHTDLENLQPNTEYALRMNAFNRFGDGEFTERKIIVTEGIPPKQPDIQSVDLLTDEPPLKAKITWKRPQLEPLESPIDRYNLWFKPEGSSEYKKKVVNGTADSVEIDGLWMGRVYDILLAAENREGPSVNASEKLETPVGNPDGDPLNVQYEIDANKMRISWDAPSEEKRNGNITLYKAVLTPMDADGERIERNVTERHAIFRVDTRKAYTFKVAAATMKGLGPFSPVLTINPDPEEFPPQPLPTDDDDEMEDESEEEEEVSTTTTMDPLDGPVNPSLCKQGLFERLDDLLNLIASGWRYHISSTDGVKESWLRFDNATNKICSMMAERTTLSMEAVTVVPEQSKEFEEISTAEVFDAIVFRQPGPLDIPLMEHISRPFPGEDDWAEAIPVTSTLPWNEIETSTPIGTTWTYLVETLVGPPSNVRVEPTSNTSVVVQWDFEAGQIDGFVIRYTQEPDLKAEDRSKWISRTVQSPSARHLIIDNLAHGKMYAFCVMAIRNNRQGACSDPLAVVDRLVPQYMVQNLHVEWKTSVSVMLKWNYEGPKPVGFYFNHTGKKEYFDQYMALKTMTTPGFKQDLPGDGNSFLLTNLRPCMSYTLHVGVYSPANQRQYWPQEVIITTDPTGPPVVKTPSILNAEGKVSSGQIAIRLEPSSEEYGPISHYWIIVIPGNYSQDDVMNLEPAQLQRLTEERRRALARQISASPTKKLKRQTAEVGTQTDPELYPEMFMEEGQTRGDRKKRDLPNTPYITARIDADDMRTMYQTDRAFLVGDEKQYNGFGNYPLEPNSKYRLMMRAFAKEDKSSPPFRRPPMTERLSRIYTDSSLGDPFSTARAPRSVGKGAGSWVVMPVVCLIVIFLVLLAILYWWRRCNKKSAPRNHRHGSITKVALTGNIMNGSGPGETSKLLSSDYGRTVMNPYENMNGSGYMESSLDLYPLPASHSRSNYAPVPVSVPCLPNGGIMGGHPPVPLVELANHIERLRMLNNQGFQNEFESIETGQQFTWENSSAEMNKHKNRYANVVAYDHSRVMLTNLDGIPGSDYINANYIDGYEKQKAYIATQGPLAETFGDFWRMVWEENSVTIVMLTNLAERTRIKCDQYWPSRGSSTYGEIQVTFLDSTELAHYTMRSFRIQAIGENEVRDIKHLQYTAWPDHGVPDHPTPFLMFLKRVKMINPPDAGPIISHCSAGIGRTGAFIVIDCMLERLRYESSVDIFGCVTALRSQRSYMVQTEDQYIFIHDAVLDAVNSGATEIPVNKLHQHMSQLKGPNLHGMTGLEMEFTHLNTLKWANTRCGVANLPINRPKNRGGAVQVLPYDNNRVVLRSIPGVDGSDYINASWVDGYKQRGAYMVTQAVMENTAFDFWRMVWENECGIIVMLNSNWDLDRGECCEYWPLDNGQQHGHLIVEPIAEYNMPEYQMREFSLSEAQTGHSRTIRHFQFTEWPEQGVPRNAENFIEFIKEVHKTKAKFGMDGPITVHCSNGAGRSGAFVALAILIDRIRLENVVDVFTTVKLLRTERQNMVQDKEQYEFLYRAALEYLNSYDQ